MTTTLPGNDSNSHPGASQGPEIGRPAPTSQVGAVLYAEPEEVLRSMIRAAFFELRLSGVETSPRRVMDIVHRVIQEEMDAIR